LDQQILVLLTLAVSLEECQGFPQTLVLQNWSSSIVSKLPQQELRILENVTPPNKQTAHFHKYEKRAQALECDRHASVSQRSTSLRFLD
jgi:hypothetical protein